MKAKLIIECTMELNLESYQGQDDMVVETFDDAIEYENKYGSGSDPEQAIEYLCFAGDFTHKIVRVEDDEKIDIDGSDIE